jgi:predicted dehydrogenase
MTTTSAEQLCSSEVVDAVMVCSVNAYHPTHTLLALKHGKQVFVEKPLAMSFRDVDTLIKAEQESIGKVFVGYMRRYAPALQHAIAEIGDKSQIQYARIRDIIGSNAYFVAQSGTYPKRFADVPAGEKENLIIMENNMYEQALTGEFGVPLNDQSKRMLLLLGGLGSHDLSAMREVLGMPQSVTGADLSSPIWSVLFRYDGFPVVYESGVNSVPTFDAHIEIYTQSKIVRVEYDTPYVKGLPITTIVREQVRGPNGEVSLKESKTRVTFEDPYTIEFKKWYECITGGRSIKTNLTDARQDVELFKMIMQAGHRENTS